MPLNLEAAAINVLEMTAYFQGKWTVDDYLDQFRDLIYDSGYTDPKTVAVKFRQGLDCWISTALTGITYRRPSDMDPEAWFRLAVRMDQNCAADWLGIHAANAGRISLLYSIATRKSSHDGQVDLQSVTIQHSIQLMKLACKSKSNL